MTDALIGQPMPLLRAPYIKLARAQKHLAELDALVAAHLATNPVTHQIVRQPGQVQMHSRWEAVPHEFGAVAGDVIHNLRSALDLLANDLVRAKQAPTKDVYFPFCNIPGDLNKMIAKRNFDRAGPAAVDLLRSLQPFKGGNDALRAIHDLDIQDKHQMLMPAHLQFTGPVVRMRKEGGVIVDVQIVPGTETETNIRFLFAEDGPLPGQDIVPALHKLVELTASILEAFKALCEADGIAVDPAGITNPVHPIRLQAVIEEVPDAPALEPVVQSTPS